MNTEQLIENAENTLDLSQAQTEDVMRLAAVGMSARDIATFLELDPQRTTIFIALAALPGSSVAKAISAGAASGIAEPQMRLQEAAASGNIEAIRELAKTQQRNRFDELLNNMDDDEFTFQALTH